MKLLHELATQVLLGSDRRPPVLPELPGQLGKLLQAACPPGEDQEIHVLRQAGSLALCGAAGYVPAVSEETPVSACPPEQLTVADQPQLLSTLQQILDDGPDPLRREAFVRLAKQGCCLAPGLLTRALNLGQKSRELRPALLAVLGQRGHWLAGLNPDWACVVGEAEPAFELASWEHGSQEQRRQLLGKLRQSAPEQARSLLQDGFSQLEARERASLLETLQVGLSLPDEDFLESLLADRSKEVRQRAASLLAALPGSRYGQRMAGRMAACLGEERKLFRTVRTLEAPASFGTDWKNDALEEIRPKNESLGGRAWWLYQIARNLPLAWWQESTGLTPAELIKWLRGTDWSEAILRAWAEALQRHPEAHWVEEFLNQGKSLDLPLDTLELLAFLPAQERERRWLIMFDHETQISGKRHLLTLLLDQFAVRPEAPSEDFSRRILAEIHQLVNRPNYASGGLYEICQTLPGFVCLIPPACFAEACEGWAVGPQTEYFSKTLARILAIVEQRKILHQILR
ncbi:MAG: DUF5691 domain-containing protein [Azonexus sp.]